MLVNNFILRIKIRIFAITNNLNYNVMKLKDFFSKEVWGEFFDESTPYVLRNLAVAVVSMAVIVGILYLTVR